MDPLLLDSGQWDRLAAPLVDLTAAAALALTAAFAFLLGHVVLPAFADQPGDLDETAATHGHDNAPSMRRPLDLLTIAAAIAMLVGLGRAVVGAIDVLQHVYPRLLI